MTDAADFTVEVRDRDFDRLGQIAPEYLNLKFVDVFNGVGAWELKLPAEHPLLPDLKAKGSGIIVTEHWLEGSTHFYRVYSGRMRSAALSQSAADPKGTWLVTGVHDNVLAAATRVYADPAAPADAQTVSHWTTAGPGETVMKQAVQLNAGSAALAGRSYPWLTVAPDQVRGLGVKTSSRFDVLGDLLTSLGTAAGLGWQFSQQGDGLQFEVYEPADKTGEVRLDIRNGGVQSNDLGFTAPSATEVLVMGQGQGEDRTILPVTSPEAQQEAEDWGIRWEVTKDQRQTDDPAELLQAGQELITEQGATVNNLKVTPSDAPNMRLGRDWYRGDRITVVVEGQETTALVTQVATSITSAGVIRQATIGDPVGFDFEAKVARKVTDHEKRIGQVERLIGQGVTWNDVLDKPTYLPGQTVTGVLAYNYRTGGRAMVHVGGLSQPATGPYHWQSEYVPAGSREVTLVWTGTTWEIQAQREYVSRLSLNTSEWAMYGPIQLDRAWNDRLTATRLPTGLVVLGGLLRGKATPAAGNVIATIEDPACWPELPVVLPVEYGDQPRGIIVYPNGEIRSEGPAIATQYLSLDGVAYWAAQSEATGNWTAVGAAGSGSSFNTGFGHFQTGTYGPVSYYKDRYGFVWFRGLIAINAAVSADNTNMVILPASHRASSEQHYRSISWGQYGGIGARTTDGLNWKPGSIGSAGTYMSPSGAVITTTDALSLNLWWEPNSSLLNSWSQYGNGFPWLTLTRRGDGLVKLRGMIAGGVQGAAITNLVGNDECLPRGKRLILPSIANNARGRMDVNGAQEDSGRSPKDLFWISAAAGVSWVSLDSMFYVP
ncbi:minor tail protein [Microbacterium phage BAjuniper]|nr:minor tail protein [Microbacterium phage BAjuniper]